MSKLKKSVNINDLIILIIMLVVAITSLIVYIRVTSGDRRDDSKPNTPTVTTEKNETEIQKATYNSSKEEVKQYLSTLGETSRMKYYCGEYIKHLQKQEYEKAYNLLYDEFKQNYFPTYESYEKYVKTFYPARFGVVYDDITRQGNLYVLRLKIIDSTGAGSSSGAGNSNSEDGGSSENEVIQRFVIRENDYDDFVLSFQVK